MLTTLLDMLYLIQSHHQEEPARHMLIFEFHQQQPLRHLLLVCLILLVVLAQPFSLHAQETQPAPGLLDAVRRDFAPASQTPFAYAYVIVRVAQFDTPENASQAIDLWFGQQRNPDLAAADFSDLQPAGVQPLKDESHALAGPIFDEDGDEFQGALLAVRDGDVLYTFESYQGLGPALDDATTIARRLFGLEPDAVGPVEGIDYRSGGLWDKLPRVEDMPEGFVMVSENKLCVGVFGAYECPPATPGASPVATPRDSPSPQAERAATTPAAVVAEPAGEVTDASSAFADGDMVTATEPINLRRAPSASADPIAVLDAGEAVTISGGPEVVEDWVWWEAVTADGTTGWVVEDFVEPVE